MLQLHYWPWGWMMSIVVKILYASKKKMQRTYNSFPLSHHLLILWGIKQFQNDNQAVVGWCHYRSALAGWVQRTKTWAVTLNSWWQGSPLTGRWWGCKTHPIPATTEDHLRLGHRSEDRKLHWCNRKKSAKRSQLMIHYLEPCLLQKMTKFGNDFLETLLLPVYLICTHTQRKREKYTDRKFPLQHGFEKEMVSTTCQWL